MEHLDKIKPKIFLPMKKDCLNKNSNKHKIYNYRFCLICNEKELKLITLFIFLNFVFACTSFCQGYKPLLKLGNKWHYLLSENLDFLKKSVKNENCLKSSASYIEYSTEVYKLVSDTAINSVIYKTLYLFNNIYPYGKLIDLLREDTINKKVFSLSDQGISLYDFNLKEGDRVPDNNYDGYDGYDEIIIDYVDSTPIGDKSYKCYFLSNGSLTIEGIGNTYGIISYYKPKSMCGPKIISLICFYSEGNLVYNSGEDDDGVDDCNYSGIYEIKTNIETVKSTYTLHPNPPAGYLIIENDKIDCFNIEFLNVQGQIIKSEKKVFKKTKLDVSGLDQGLYFVRITDKNQKYIYKVIICPN